MLRARTPGVARIDDHVDARNNEAQYNACFGAAGSSGARDAPRGLDGETPSVLVALAERILR